MTEEEHRQKETSNSTIEPGTIASLITELSCEYGLERMHARKKLVHIGQPAVPELVRSLSHENECVRWEAARALGHIQDRSTATALVKAMDDSSFGVRWLAAEAVVKLGQAGLVSLLEALKRHTDSREFREGAHHVLRLLDERGFHDIVAPVLQALEGVEPTIEVPITAQAVLDNLEETSSPTD